MDSDAGAVDGAESTVVSPEDEESVPVVEDSAG